VEEEEEQYVDEETAPDGIIPFRRTGVRGETASLKKTLQKIGAARLKGLRVAEDSCHFIPR
jgi:hypothetical protein